MNNLNDNNNNVVDENENSESLTNNLGDEPIKTENRLLKLGKSTLSKGLKGLNEIKNQSVKGFNELKKVAIRAYEGIKDSIEFKNAFNEETYEFEVLGAFNKLNQQIKIRAFRLIDENELLFKCDDNDIKRILSGTILKTVKDYSLIEITMIDDKKQVNYKLLVKEEECNVPCFKAKFKLYENKKQVINNVNQSISISNSTIHGDVNQINEINNKLDELENLLKNAKPGLFGKAKSNQQDAIKLYGSFRNCVINGKKDDPIIKKFIDLAISVIPNIVTIVASLFV